MNETNSTNSTTTTTTPTNTFTNTSTNTSSTTSSTSTTTSSSTTTTVTSSTTSSSTTTTIFPNTTTTTNLTLINVPNTTSTITTTTTKEISDNDNASIVSDDGFSVSPLVFLVILAIPIGYCCFLGARRLKRYLRYKEFLSEFDSEMSNSTKNIRGAAADNGAGGGSILGLTRDELNLTSTLKGLSTGTWANVQNAVGGISSPTAANQFGDDISGFGGAFSRNNNAGTITAATSKSGLSFDDFRVVSTAGNNNDDDDDDGNKKKNRHNQNHVDYSSDEEGTPSSSRVRRGNSFSTTTGRFDDDDEDSFGDSSPNIGFVEGAGADDTEDLSMNNNSDAVGGGGGKDNAGTYVDLEERDEERQTAQIVSMAVLQTILK